MSNVIVITGSTKGIGLALAASFLRAGQRVMISGRGAAALAQALEALSQHAPADALAGTVCDVAHSEAVARLWDETVARWGRVDMWVNNAGVAHPQRPLWELAEADARAVFESNVLGVLLACRVVIPRLQAQGGGYIFNFEGFGSNGRVRPGLGAYGASKAAVAFINKTLTVELAGTPVRVVSVQPGMVMTDMVLGQYRHDPAALEKVKPIFNIIASRVEEVAPVLAQKMLANPRHGAHLAFLPPWGLAWRFLTAPFLRRDVFTQS